MVSMRSSERLKAMLGYLEKLTLDPKSLGQSDIVELRNAGLSNRAIEEAAFVAFDFSVMDRLAEMVGISGWEMRNPIQNPKSN